jgi:hypothetical protein
LTAPVSTAPVAAAAECRSASGRHRHSRPAYQPASSQTNKAFVNLARLTRFAQGQTFGLVGCARICASSADYRAAPDADECP